MALIRSKFFLLRKVCLWLPSNVCSPCSLLVLAEYSLVMAWPPPGETAQGDAVKSGWVVGSLGCCEISRRSRDGGESEAVIRKAVGLWG